MKMKKLSRDEAEKELGEAGILVESNQNGISRVQIGGLVFETESAYSSLSVSVPEKPKPVEKYVVVSKPIPVFEKESEAEDFIRKLNDGIESQFEVRKITVEAE